MRQDVLGNVLNLATLVQSSRSGKSLGDLVEKPAPSSLQTLINMMSPVNAIPSLKDVKAFLLTLPTVYPTAIAPGTTYTPVQLQVLQGLKAAVVNLNPGSFNVLGFPIVSIFDATLAHCDEIANLVTDVTGLINAEIARVNVEAAEVAFSISVQPVTEGEVLPAGTPTLSVSLTLGSKMSIEDTITVTANDESYMAPVALDETDIANGYKVVDLDLSSAPTDTPLVFKFLVVQHVDSAIVSVETLPFSIASGV